MFKNIFQDFAKTSELATPEARTIIVFKKMFNKFISSNELNLSLNERKDLKLNFILFTMNFKDILKEDANPE